MTGYPSIDKIHLQGIPEEKLHPEILPASMLATFMKINGEHLDEVAVEANGEVYTKQNLKDDAVKFAGWLLKNDVKAGDKIIITTPNSYEGIVATFGANAIGVAVAVTHPFDEVNAQSFYDELDMHHPKMVLFYDSSAASISVTRHHAEYINAALVAKPLDSYTRQKLGFRDIIDSAEISLEETMAEIEKHSLSETDEPMLYLKTSGSSSKPKTLPFSNRAIFATLIYVVNSTGTDTRDEGVKKILCQASYYHGYGWMPLFISVIGGNPIILAGATPKDIANYYKLKPSFIFGSPLTLKQFMELTPKNADVSSIVAFYCAGAVLHEKDYEEGIKYFRDRGCQAEIRNNYGISEGLCIGTVGDHIAHVPGTSGKFYVGPEWLIVDEAGNEVKYGKTGELIVSAASLCQGYYGDEELTREHFIKRDGKTFFKTGDSFSLREDGYVSFLGRDRRFFIAEGIFEKVNCETVEEALSSLNGVYQAAVVVTPDETGCRAFIALEDGYVSNNTAKEELKKSLTKLLKSYQMPREFVFIDKIPMMESGKVDYKLLETM